MAQPQMRFQELINQCMDQMRKQLEALAALQANEDEAREQEFLEAYEQERAKTLELDAKLKEARASMLN